MKWFCKHEWKMISETITRSEAEVIAEIPNLKSINGCDFGRKIIQVVSCTKCGKLERFVDRI